MLGRMCKLTSVWSSHRPVRTSQHCCEPTVWSHSLSLANMSSDCFVCDKLVLPATQRRGSFHMKTACRLHMCAYPPWQTPLGHASLVLYFLTAQQTPCRRPTILTLQEDFLTESHLSSVLFRLGSHHGLPSQVPAVFDHASDWEPSLRQASSYLTLALGPSPLNQPIHSPFKDLLIWSVLMVLSHTVSIWFIYVHLCVVYREMCIFCAFFFK